MRTVLLLVLFVIGPAESLGLTLLPALLFPHRGLSVRVTRVGHLTRSGMSSVEPGNWLDNIGVDIRAYLCSGPRSEITDLGPEHKYAPVGTVLTGKLSEHI